MLKWHDLLSTVADGNLTRYRVGRESSSLTRQFGKILRAWLPKTIRLPHRIAHALDRAYLEQRLKYAKPDTQQEIAEEALTDWLAKSGYLD